MRLGFGCVNLGSASGGASRRDQVRLVAEAVDRGVTVFDTADVYGSGGSERVLGEGIGRRRAEVLIATKAGYVFREKSSVEQSARRAVKSVLDRVRPRSGGQSHGGGSGAYAAQDFSPGHLRAAVDGSLRRLRTDYLDLLQLHGPHDVQPDLLAQLHDLVQTGKVRRFGIGAESVAEGAAWVPVEGVDVVQVPFGVLDPEAREDVLPVAEQYSVQVWARGVLGGGVLRAAAEGHAAVRDDPNWPRIERITELSRRTGIDVMALAVGFVRAHAGVSTVLTGISTRDHLLRNLELMAAAPLDDEVLAELRGHPTD
jgi:aryl-alcohol dehydrogenase-like predicted oxidoreductase